MTDPVSTRCPTATPSNSPIYVGGGTGSTAHRPFYAVCDLLHRHHFDGASALLGVDGTAHGERRRAHFFARNVDCR